MPQRAAFRFVAGIQTPLIRFAFAAAGLCLLVYAAGEQPALAEDHEAERILFDIDDPPELTHQLFEGLSVGGEIDTEFFFLRNSDLDDGESDDIANITPTLAVAVSYDPGRIFDAFLELQIERSEDFGSPEEREVNETRLLVDEAYLTFPDVVDGISFRVGRDRIRDQREWLLDEELDGVRAFGRWDNLALELSASRFRLLDEDLLNAEAREEINNYLAIGRYEPTQDLKGRAYVLHRDNQDPATNDLTFIGVQGSAVVAGDWEFWLDAAHVRGRDDGVRVRGYGVDVGTVFAPDLPLGPSATLGFAFGSGDGDPDDGTDHAFRQSGLQANEDAFNGVTRFLYYGEAFDPELSNLAILTVGLGLRPSELTSIDLVYHGYWQDEPADFLGDAAIEASPGGSRRHLGDGLDLIIGVSEFDNVDFDMTLGAFFPGSGFTGDEDPAFVATFELAIEF